MAAVQKKPAPAKESGGGSHGIPEGELLGTLALVGLIYFTAAGGAYGRNRQVVRLLKIVGLFCKRAL